jgi:hypothetical protein
MRRALQLLALLTVLGLAISGWAAWQLVQGGRALQRASGELHAVRGGLGDGGALVPRLQRAADDTGRALDHLDDPAVRAVGRLPLLRRPVLTATAIADSTDSAVRDALLPIARAAGDDPAARLFHDGAVDLTYLDSLSGPAAVAAEALREATFTLGQSPRRSGVGQVDSARMQLANGLSQLRDIVEQLSLGSRVAPALLGVDAPRRYLVVAQNPAEARGTGGLVGGFVLLEADNGILRTVVTGANTDLSAFSGGPPVADLGAEFTDHYRALLPTGNWVNSNPSPHFPYAATVWRALWEKQTGQQVAGALAVDPIALSYLMKATGPVRLSDGVTATADNVVDLTLRDTYLRFQEADQSRRKNYLQEISRGVAGSLGAGDVDPRALLSGLTRSAGEGRLQFWAADPAVEAELAGTAVTGRLPEGRPAVGNAVFNVIGSKLDYYLERTFSYSPGCGSGPSSASLTLRNTAPRTGLPPYVSPAVFRGDLPAGTNRVLVTMYLPPQSSVLEARQGPDVVQPRQGNELGLRWAEFLVTLEPGSSTTLQVSFEERLGARADVERVSTPLVRPERFTVTDCAR